MEKDFFNALWARLRADAALVAIFAAIPLDPKLPAGTPPYPPTIRYNRGRANDFFPYLVYGCKFIPDDNESFALGNGYLTVDIWDKNNDGNLRSWALAQAVKASLNRQHITGPSFSAQRFFLTSSSNIPTDTEEVMRQELIFRFRYYDKSIATPLL